MSDMKQRMVRLATELVTSSTAVNVLSNPQVQDAIRRAFNLRSDVREEMDKHVDTIARALNLVSRTELQTLKRTIRELENQAAALEYELRQQRERAEKAEQDLADALQAAGGEAAPTKKPVAKKAAPKKPAAKKPAAKKTEES